MAHDDDTTRLPRSSRVTVLLTPDEKAELARQADRLGVSRSDILRSPLHPASAPEPSRRA